VFTTSVGTTYESHNLRRDFRWVTAAAGLGARWVRKELRTSFVSMISYRGVPVEEIARLPGHASSRTTGMIYQNLGYCIRRERNRRSAGHGRAE
jgi:integrase